MVYIGLYLAICFILVYAKGISNKTKLLIIFLLGTFLAGYRSVRFTGDNIYYAQSFLRNAATTIGESWKNVIQQEGKDPFYYFLSNVFSKLGFTYREWFVFIAAVYVGGFCYLLYRHSDDWFLSILFFVCLSYYYFSMTGLRQTLAMGVCFFAYDYALRKRPIPFVLLVYLASLFHSSALIFLPFYLTKNLRIDLRQWVIVLLSLAVAVLFPDFINTVVEELAWNENLSSYAEVKTGLSIFGFLIQFCIMAFCYYLTRFDRKNDSRRRPWFAAMLAGLVIQAFVINIDNIFRMSMYYSIYGAFAVPEAIKIQPMKNKRILFLAVSAALLIYWFRAGSFKYFSLFGGV